MHTDAFASSEGISNEFKQMSMGIFYRSIINIFLVVIIAIESKAASSVVEVSYFSKTMNSTRKLNVYLPDGYNNNSSTYPTFYLMHGGGQRYYTWINEGNAKAILDLAISSGKAKPMIVIMPDVPDFAPALFTKELCNDVIPFVDKTYRTKTDKDNRALAGLSWGGLQVLDAGLYRYDLFGYMGVFSSGWFIGDNVYNVMKNYLAANGAKIQKSMRYLYFGQGGTSDIAYSNGAETMKVLRSYGITVNYWEHSGSHSFVAWKQDLRDFIPFLFQSSECLPTVLTPYSKVFNGNWNQISSFNNETGSDYIVLLGPQPETGGIWSWSGCGLSGNSREQQLSTKYSCKAIATFTNDCGAKSSLTFEVMGIINSLSSDIQKQQHIAFPNPFVEDMILQLDHPFVYRIFSMNGQEIETGCGNGRTSIGGSLGKGIYWLKLESGVVQRNMKIIKK